MMKTTTVVVADGNMALTFHSDVLPCAVMAQLPDILDALIEDGLALWRSIPGTAIARQAIEAHLRRRAETAREIWLDELGRGNVDAAVVAVDDDSVAAIYHYLRSSWEGRARVNLRLLAQAIIGRLTTGALVADEFLPHADALAELSRDEIVLLATMHRCFVASDKSVHSKWDEVERELAAHGWDRPRVLGTAGRATRSGYVFAQSSGLGQMVVSVAIRYVPSPHFADLYKTVDFDDALPARIKHAASPA